MLASHVRPEKKLVLLKGAPTFFSGRTWGVSTGQCSRSAGAKGRCALQKHILSHLHEQRAASGLKNAFFPFAIP
ncbi:hypothetical protein KSD_83090 [Ktedonobacter sp. SOSP1-85]|nr:hypothetical protein KSD_83090 [Ktedonobacter sp. SOSP1-85]